MITQQQIDAQQLGERYLADQLCESERKEYERHYATHPEALQDLQVIAAIKTGLGLLRTSGELQKLTAPPRRPPWRRTLAIAAMLVVSSIVIGAVTRNQPRPLISFAASATALTAADGTPVQLGESYDLERTRSDVDLRLRRSAIQQAVQLRLRISLEPIAGQYRVQLLSITADETRTPVATANAIPLDAEGFIRVYLNVSQLQDGSYELQVFNDSDPQSSVTDFLIEVTPPRRS